MEKKIPTFEEMVILAPEEIKDILLRNAETPQSPNWHPEGNVLKHIQIVYNRARKSRDLDMVVTAFFHDLGKASTTRPSRNTKGSWSSYGHELASLRLVEKYKDWIESLGANYERVHELVKYHMKIKLMGEMRPIKQQEMRDNPYYKDLLIFTEFDNMKTLHESEIR